MYSNGFRLVRRENQYAIRDFRENGWLNNQRSPQLARHWVDQAVLCIHDITELLTIDLQNNLDGQIRRIFEQADQRLIIHREGAKRSRFTKPIGLGIGISLRDLARQTATHEF